MAAIKKSSNLEFQLPNTLDGKTLSKLKKDMINHLGQNNRIIIDFKNVNSVNTKAVQFFVSLDKYTYANSKSFAVANYSKSLQDAFGELGFDFELKRWSK